MREAFRAGGAFGAGFMCVHARHLCIVLEYAICNAQIGIWKNQDVLLRGWEVLGSRRVVTEVPSPQQTVGKFSPWCYSWKQFHDVRCTRYFSHNDDSKVRDRIRCKNNAAVIDGEMDKKG